MSWPWFDSKQNRIETNALRRLGRENGVIAVTIGLQVGKATDGIATDGTATEGIDEMTGRDQVISETETEATDAIHTTGDGMMT